MGSRVRSAARGASAVLLSIAIAACQSTWFDTYRAEHPDFDPTLPRVGASLPALLAALHAPTDVERIEVELSRLAIFRVDGERWQEVPFASIRSGAFTASADHDYAVLVAWTCRFDQGLSEQRVVRAGFHLLPGNAVAAYDHYGFRDRCAVDDQFLAARGPLVRVEREAVARLGGLGARLSLAQAYRRGLAYLEAGRIDEARAMLLVGERSYRASAAALRAAGRTDVLAEVDPMRASLMRALGVTPRDAGPRP